MSGDGLQRWNRRDGFRVPGEGENREPSFDVDWRYGNKAEKLVRELCDMADRDEIRLEVKRKRRDDGYFYVELEHDPGRRGSFVLSGLSVTTADVWAFAIAATGIVLMTRAEILRTAIERNYGFPASETDGSCPTRGRLLSVWDLLAAGRPGKPSRAVFGDEFRVPV